MTDMCPSQLTNHRHKSKHFLYDQHLMTLKKPATAPCGKSTELKETINVCIHLSAILCLALSGVMLQELHITSVLCKQSDTAAEARKQALCCTECSISVSKLTEIPREQKSYHVHLVKL